MERKRQYTGGVEVALPWLNLWSEATQYKMIHQ